MLVLNSNVGPVARLVLNRPTAGNSLSLDLVSELRSNLSELAACEDIKVIILADTYIYHLLQHYDEDVPKIFKVRADFDSTMDNTAESVAQFARFIRTQGAQHGLRPFDRSAVAALVEEAVRMGGRVPIPVAGPGWWVAARTAELLGAPLPPHARELLERGGVADGAAAVRVLGVSPRSTPEVVQELYRWETVVHPTVSSGKQAAS